MWLNLRPHGLWFDDRLSLTNAHPVSPIPSSHTIPTKIALRESNSTSVANAMFLSLQFCNFFNFAKSHPLTLICPDLTHCSSSDAPSPHTLFEHDPLHHSMAWTGQYEYESYVTRLTTILTAMLFRARPFIQGEPFCHKVTSNDRAYYAHSPLAFLRQWASFDCQFDEQLVERRTYAGEWQSPDVVVFVCVVLKSAAN